VEPLLCWSSKVMWCEVWCLVVFGSDWVISLGVFFYSWLFLSLFLLDVIWMIVVASIFWEFSFGVFCDVSIFFLFFCLYCIIEYIVLLVLIICTWIFIFYIYILYLFAIQKKISLINYWNIAPHRGIRLGKPEFYF
jgi:hypothetical protein